MICVGLAGLEEMVEEPFSCQQWFIQPKSNWDILPEKAVF